MPRNGLIEIMTFEEALASTPHRGWLKEDEARLLWDRVNQSPRGTVLEVGSYYGRSTVLLAHTGHRIYVVDPFVGFDTCDMSGEDAYKGLIENLMKRGLYNVTIFKQKIEEWSILPVVFAYLDGDHTFEGTVAQIKIAIEAGAKRMCIHDYERAGDGLEVVRAVASIPLNVVETAGRMAYCEVYS